MSVSDLALGLTGPLHCEEPRAESGPGQLGLIGSHSLPHWNIAGDLCRHRPFTFIDLFAGIGGFRLAFETLGGECVFSSEWDKYAARTYCANFGETPFGDITLDETKARIPHHDLLCAGFPCQPFSLAGVSKHTSLGREHGFAHPTQGTLFFEVAQIIRDHRPSMFILENVKNLVGHDRGRTFEVITQTLEKELEYQLDWAVLDAAPLVPQHRERVYLVGFRDKTPFAFPVLEDRRPALGTILEQQVDDKYTLSDRLWEYLQAYAEKHRRAGNGFGFSLARPDGVVRTLSARYHKDGSEILVPQRGKNPRRLTPRECARLMGFPEEYQIAVSDTQAYRQFGNSVAAPVVAAIGDAMLHAAQGTAHGASESICA
ncbi:MAG: DNA (cytosine-5-)-methyltransferase [Coriobacteriia bacterium]